MAEAYLTKSKRSIRTLAAATGVSQDTASRAISSGWPERKWASLRERAELYDRQRSTSKKFQPLTLAEVQTLQTFLATKLESANTLRAISGFAQNALVKLQAAVDRATSDRHGTRRRTVVDVTVSGTGKRAVRREVHKTVVEDVIEPPYLPHIMAAAKAGAEIVAIANEGVRRWMIAKPGEDLDRGAKVGWADLSAEQLKYIGENDGKLPPGVTREMLGWST